ncbi:glutaredoxin [Cytobacillus eiseniae]|uniref:Glutaredoxin n=1 Tax=Cytobacillus eiseniae TaxID=762947 RepID=A0ABS4RC74_9BACI|nr:glutaredoxin family protein [Cytobacillus eiseniae]MBP2240319.1 glutaredoxin [Cytobacillus eiseniae]
MKKSTLVLYTRDRCMLCEKAKKIIVELQNKYDFLLEEIDIDSSDELTEKYGIMIPVVEIDGKEVQYGQIDEWTLSEAFSEKKNNY